MGGRAEELGDNSNYFMGLLGGICELTLMKYLAESLTLSGWQVSSLRPVLTHCSPSPGQETLCFPPAPLPQGGVTNSDPGRQKPNALFRGHLAESYRLGSPEAG